MKLTINFPALIFGVLFLANAAYAESPREQLQQMVEQLQKTPSDNVLREKIIKLAQEIKPAPAIPEEAIRDEGRAQYVFTNAKNEQDYLDAAKEYERAVGAAPWVVGYYSDLCTIYEKAGKLAEAKRNCEFSLAGTSDPSLAVDIKRRIAGLEIGMERNRPESIAARKIEESKKRGVAGFWQIQSGRVVYCNRTNCKADGVWNEYSGPSEMRKTYEIRKIGDSYEIARLDAPHIPYKIKKADITTIDFGRPDCVEGKHLCDYSHQCKINGEQLFCSVRNWSYGGVRGDGERDEERWVRRESCVVGPKDQNGDVTVRCR
jgi:hypothetical protein